MDSEVSDTPQENPYKLRFFQKTKFTFFLFNVYTFIQLFNMQTLSSSMRGLEMDLGYSPKKLSYFVLVEQISILFFVPIWGVLSDLFESKFLLFFSLSVSGLSLLLLLWAKGFFLNFLVRALNGAMIGGVIPITQKYVALSNMENSGYAFGLFHAVSSFARLVCSIVVTYVGSNVYFGYYGWRLSSFATGIFCFFFSALMFLVPRLKPKNYRKSLYDILNLESDKKFSESLKVIWDRFLSIMSVKTSKILTLSTFFGQGPYIASYFVTIYFQYCRLSNLKSGLTSGLIPVGSTLGGYFGGIVSDYLNRKFHKYGRLLIGIVLACFRLLGFGLALYCVTFDNILDLYPLLGLVLFIIGITFASISFVDRVVATDVLMPSEQGFGTAAILFVAGATSSLIFPPLMGLLVKEVFGYQETTMELSKLDYTSMRNNAFALRNGIGCMCLFSASTSLLFYILMLFTYNKDSKRVREAVENKTKFAKVRVVTDSLLQRNVSRKGTEEFRM